MSGDEISVDFVKDGDGYEPFTTDSGYYYSRSENNIAVRTIDFRITDPEAGTVLILSDKPNNGHKIEPIYPMTEVRMFCLDPRNKKDQITAVNKAAPLTVTDLTGNPLLNQSVEVWRIDLNGFRALS